jgi:hypothetical protein
MKRRTNRLACCSVVAVLGLMELTSCANGNNHGNPSIANPVQSVAATSGTPQSHAINGTFGAPLIATVTTNGLPASGVTVTFTAPPTGPSGTFSNTNSTTANAMTDTNGLAASPAFTANQIASLNSPSYTVTATVAGVPVPASFSLTNTPGPPAAITLMSGTPQSAGINAAFKALMVTVVDGGQNPVSGAIVTFTAPASGASGTFADTSSNTTTASTNTSGVAASTVFTANATSGTYIVTAAAAGVSTPVNFTLTNLAGGPATITATGGTPQSTPISTAFAAPLLATVLDADSNPVSGAVVTFTAPNSSASGTFVNGTITEAVTTNASGVATSNTFTANANAGGPYVVTAAVAGVSTTTTFNLTNRPPSKTYVFYLGGQTAGLAFYSLAGLVEISPKGTVLFGEQDYNGAPTLTSPEPSGDTITGGNLTVNGAGQGTLTLNTNNTSVGVGGIETLGVQFVNSNHALIIEFDGSATSSGSMDLQTLPSALNGGYAFTLSGVDINSLPVAYGGVFSVNNGTTLQNGLVDTNDDGTVTTGTALTGTLSTPGTAPTPGASDEYGRGTITSVLNYEGNPIVLNYYIVGAEAIRIIDVDSTDSAVGSAFGQGVNAISSSNASLGSSVFAVDGVPFPPNYAFAGLLNTSPATGTFSGVADDNELINGIQLSASLITGTYAIGSNTLGNNGYGSLSIAPGDLGDVSALGIYLTDPTLNLIDPNNITSGFGGALVADMDSALPGGTGVLIPQTNTTSAQFTGHYAFGAQDTNLFIGTACEFDFVGQGSVTTAGGLSGTGLVSDPSVTLGASTTNTGVTFSGVPLPDPSNAGRYTMSSSNSTPNPFVVTINSVPTDFDITIYQASGGLLFWLDEDTSSVFLGSMQQRGSLTGTPAARNPMGKAEPKHKQ